jgi:phage shock protein E
MNHAFTILILSLWLGQIPATFAESPNEVIIDVRTPEEYQDSRLKDSLNIDFLSPDFKAKAQKLDKNKTYKFYCRSGNRSGQAEKILKSLGFINVENVGSLKQAAQKLNRDCEGKDC